MPTYVFTNPKTGENFDKYLEYSDFDLLFRDDDGRKIYVIEDGTNCFLNLGEQLVKTRIEDSEIWNGMESHALAVHPEQIREEKEYAKKRGVDIDFNPQNGRPRFSSRKNRRDYCKLRGVVDYDGGFSDSI